MTETTRRRFLNFLGLGAAAAVAAPELLKAAPKPYASGGFVGHASLGLIGERSGEYLMPRGVATLVVKHGTKLFPKLFPGDFVQLDTEGFVGKMLLDSERRIGQVISVEPNKEGTGIVATVRFDGSNWSAES